ncbi:MAG: hypothetical protein COV52_07270 [Gammaproteobacteria bacterium CG11_big_fil_rev_8_21_14_0_20_46_22]|nr:MAG: hypothetical protein COW05_00285 [Gammaproteobacteria bacterium CG12_big_fil_rev_8_21_14_0_65_46_12]PIR10834.1 MAG: hypothetical protein COV52_07270 [Gammaproteobacteria bacterium CG11_big_fil_rev_8_21_14_0_20_46_22]
MKSIRQFLIAGACLLLAACGFHLANSTQAPPVFKTLKLESNDPNGDFSKLVRSNLKLQGVNINPKAPITLKLELPSATYSQATSGSSQISRDYTVVQNASFTFINSKTHKTIDSREFSVSQSLTLYAGQIINNTSQLQSTISVLRRSVLNQFFFYLESSDLVKAAKASLKR